MLFNSLGKKKEVFFTNKKKEVSMYVFVAQQYMTYYILAILEVQFFLISLGIF